MTTYSKAYGKHIFAVAMMHGLLAAVPTFGSRAPQLSDPVPFTRGSNGTGGRRSARSVLSLAMRRCSSKYAPHQGARECQRRRLGGSHRAHHHSLIGMDMGGPDKSVAKLWGSALFATANRRVPRPHEAVPELFEPRRSASCP